MKLQLIKFGGSWCGACQLMEDRRVLEQFGATTPDINIIKHECPGPDDETEDPLADAYDAMSMPTLVFEDVESGREISRYEGGLSFTDLRKFYEATKLLASGADLPKELKRWRQKREYSPRAGGYYGVQEHVAPEGSV